MKLDMDVKPPRTRRVLLHNLGPNCASVYARSGKRPRQLTDLTYEVMVVVKGKWTLVRRYSNEKEALAFAEGYVHGVGEESGR